MKTTMCSSCHGTGQCEFCEGAGSVKKSLASGPITIYETKPCAVCSGSGKCPSCSPDAALSMNKLTASALA